MFSQATFLVCNGKRISIAMSHRPSNVKAHQKKSTTCFHWNRASHLWEHDNLMSKHGCQTSLALQWTESHCIRGSFVFKFKCTKSEDFGTTSLLFKEMANSYQNSHLKNWNFRLRLIKIIVSSLSTASLCQNPLTSSFQQNNLTNSYLSQGFLLLKIIYQPWKVKHLQHKHNL